MKQKKILSIKNLSISFPFKQGYFPVVDDISFSLEAGKTIALVGESGSGKSVTALSILRILESPPAKIKADEMIFQERDLLKLKQSEMQKLRGNKLAMIFQNPMTSLNPVFTVGEQVAEVLRLHKNFQPKEALEASIELFQKVKIPAADKRVFDYPYQLSGGMRQRVMIAMALSCQPSLLIADEPTTALDVTVQSQIIDLISNLQEEMQMTVLMITHDLGLVAERCESIFVMYAGRIVEKAKTQELFSEALHPYTKGLINSIPSFGMKSKFLPSISGQVPRVDKLPSGCRFRDRCPYSMQICREKEPPLLSLSETRSAACWLLDKKYQK